MGEESRRLPLVSREEAVPGRAGRHRGIMWVYVNGRCNFTCNYCLDGRNSLTGRIDDHPDYLDRLVRLQAQLGYVVCLTGGEPLLQDRVVADILRAFRGVTKCLQTNGGLTDRLARVLPHLEPHDWVSISWHDETLDHPAKRQAVRNTVALLESLGVRTHLQFMCSPRNVEAMLAAAGEWVARGYRVSLRRLFTDPPEAFAHLRDRMAEVNTEAWATAAFFHDRADLQQPFAAANVHLDGRITMVCQDEVPVGNLYTGYDLGQVTPLLGLPCDTVCHCCSCLWADTEWGFA
jgi:hypothetical protein